MPFSLLDNFVAMRDKEREYVFVSPDNFAISVTDLSDKFLNLGLTTSSIVNADKLLSPDDSVL